MIVTLEDVRHIARLARLAFDEEELLAMRGEMEALLSHFSRISALDTSLIPPTTSVLPLANVLREDTPHMSLSHEDALANAPEREGGFFRIRTFLEERGDEETK
jgi:aspartyl-tRNA(Asn)/glutamyl-tRNA(Gln) amidotransferase subunit C